MFLNDMAYTKDLYLLSFNFNWSLLVIFFMDIFSRWCKRCQATTDQPTKEASYHPLIGQSCCNNMAIKAQNFKPSKMTMNSHITTTRVPRHTNTNTITTAKKWTVQPRCLHLQQRNLRIGIHVRKEMMIDKDWSTGSLRGQEITSSNDSIQVSGIR